MPRLLHLLVAVGCVAGSVSSVHPLAAEEPKPNQPPAGYRALCNGQDLAGWRGMGTENPYQLAAKTPEEQAAFFAKNQPGIDAHWKVVDGVLINDGQGPYLTTIEDFGDIELWVDYKTVPKADSGIYLRATPQVQIWDSTETEKFKIGADKGSGGLWNNSAGAPGKDPLVAADKPFGEWNRFRIVQVGARTSVWLNDKLVVDNARMENYWDRKKPLVRRGPIQLQTHGGEISWKNVFVRELGAEEANRWLREHAGDGFEPVFNGQDLSGWAGAKDNYEVVDGAIRCQPGTGRPGAGSAAATRSTTMLRSCIVEPRTASKTSRSGAGTRTSRAARLFCVATVPVPVKSGERSDPGLRLLSRPRFRPSR